MPRVLQERPLASLAALLHQGGGAEQSCNAGWVCVLVLIQLISFFFFNVFRWQKIKMF